MRIDQMFLIDLFVIIENTGKRWNLINLGHMTSSVQSEAYALQSSSRGQQHHSCPTNLLTSRPNRKAKMRSRIQAGQRKRGSEGKGGSRVFSRGMHTSASKETYRSQQEERSSQLQAQVATVEGVNPLDARVMLEGLW